MAYLFRTLPSHYPSQTPQDKVCISLEDVLGRPSDTSGAPFRRNLICHYAHFGCVAFLAVRQYSFLFNAFYKLRYCSMFV